jgi:prephenate dehydratase
MGEYIFFVDLELADSTGAEALQAVLDDLAPLCEHLALFGAYPITTEV